MASEKRLNDAEAIARKLKRQYCAECNVVRQIQCSACWVNDVLELLDGDSVDAVEVVHGHWEIRPDPYRSFYHGYACSACGGWKHKLAFEHENMNYCPNCGADMRERKDNGKE